MHTLQTHAVSDSADILFIHGRGIQLQTQAAQNWQR